MTERRTPANKGRTYPAEPLNADEIQRLLRACSNRAPTGIRNRALIVALWRAQLRVSEALALHPSNIDTAAGTITVLHGKGDQRRVVGIDETAMAVLCRWLDVRASRGIKGHARLFCTLSGKPMATAYVRAMLPRLARRAGIEKRVHPHGLRHTGAFELANEGVPMHVLRAQLGHSSLATTDRYIRHLNPTTVIESMRSRSWPGESTNIKTGG